MTWSTEDAALLRARWFEGYSSTEIAEEMGRTRGGVIGKARRLGLLGTPKRFRRQTKAEKKAKTPKADHPWKKNDPKAPRALSDEPEKPLRASVHGPVVFHDLKNRSCRWPLWASGGSCPPPNEQRYCGEERDGTSPYCAHHTELATRPPTSTEKRAATLKGERW